MIPIGKTTMTLATQRFTLDEYYNHTDGTDNRYELVNGELVAMTLGKGQHGEVADFLNTSFRTEIKRSNQPWVSKQMVVGIQSPRADRWDTVRIPDVVVLSLDQWRSLRNREAVIPLNESPPLLVVEVVSESTKAIDYRAKRAEYSVLNSPEYWIVDPILEKLTLCVLSDGWYDSTEFTDTDVIQSPTFPQLGLTVAEILSGDL